MEAPAAETTLIVPSQRQRTDEIHVGLSWTEGLGKYKLTKIITLAPRFLLKNNLSDPLSFREHGVAPRERSTIKPGERCPLQVMKAGQEKLLTVAFTGLNAQWYVHLKMISGIEIDLSPRSPPINVEDLGSIHFRLREPGNTSLKESLIRADVMIDGSTIFVSFFAAGDGWPFMVENESDYEVELCQTVWDLP